MKGDVQTRRCTWGAWSRRWEATQRVGHSAWVVKYGVTRRRALRALRREMGGAK